MTPTDFEERYNERLERRPEPLYKVRGVRRVYLKADLPDGRRVWARAAQSFDHEVGFTGAYEDIEVDDVFPKDAPEPPRAELPGLAWVEVE